MSALQQRLASLGTIEKTAIVLSGVAVCFLIVDPLVLSAVRGVDGVNHGIFRSLTHLGRSNWILIPLGASLIVLAWLRTRERAVRRVAEYRHWMRVLTFAFASIALSGLGASLAKNVIGRARPKLFTTQGPLEFHPISFDADFASFPSGHATTAGALVAVLGIFWPQARIYFLLAGAWIAATRFFIGAHYLSDVVAGFLFGMTFVLFLRDRLAKRNWLFRPGRDGVPVVRGRIYFDRLSAFFRGQARKYLTSPASG